MSDYTPCEHDRAGIVSNQPYDYDREQPLASTAVCGDPSCRARALGWVYQVTGQQGTYVSDKDRA